MHVSSASPNDRSDAPAALPASNARVLVAVLNRRADLTTLTTNHWYRIPLRHAPATLAVDYLAFYQTGAFGTAGHAIRYYAALVGYRIATRRDLLPHEADHPRANDRYYCMQLGTLHTLAYPIPAARLRRITFILTSFGQLRRAHDVRDLWHAPELAADPPTDAPDVWAAGIAGHSLREPRPASGAYGRSST